MKVFLLNEKFYISVVKGFLKLGKMLKEFLLSSSKGRLTMSVSNGAETKLSNFSSSLNNKLIKSMETKLKYG